MYSAHPYSIPSVESSCLKYSRLSKSRVKPICMAMMACLRQLTELSYALYGQVGNVFNEKVFTKTGVQLSEMVKLHLGLKDLVPERGLMDM